MVVEALPILGAGLGWLTLLELPFLLIPGLNGTYAGLIWLAGLAALAALVWALATGARIPGAAVRQDQNLIARLGDAPVSRWIVAHVDTKAQGHSMAGRLVAVWLLVLTVGVVTTLVAWRMASGVLPGAAVAGAAGLVSAAGLLAGRGRLRGSSPGARDNATGLLAALVVADARVEGIGFFFSGAEEFALAGMRAHVERGGSVTGADWVNIDTITGRGRLYLVSHDAAGATLAGTLLPLLQPLGTPVEQRRLPAGILVDSVALARAGARACTIARLDWSDLRRLHTPGDSVEDLDPETAEKVGRALTTLG
jgi:hypothetical protein